MSTTEAAAPDTVIDVHGLTKSFNGRAGVRDLSMQVKRGTIFGFLGPNGSGKTTTIRMLCGLLTPDQGNGTCLGYHIRTETLKIKVNVGYMTQRFSLYEDLSVRENLEFIARIYGLPRPANAAANMIARLGLQGREEQVAGKLSGGWKARRDFWDEIHKLAAQGLTVLVSTHYMDEAERCHEIAYIAFGEVLTRGTVQEVINNSHLTTFTVTATHGEHVSSLADELKDRPGINMVTAFGTSLHVSGHDSAALEHAVAPFRERPGLDWQRGAPSLEDVFIDL